MSQIVHNEIKILRKLRKLRVKKIGGLRSVFEDDENIYLLQDYKKGGDLKARIKQVGSLDEQSIKEIIKQILNTLSKLHAKNILHRDLTPQNVMFDYKFKTLDEGDSLRVSLIDFGLALKLQMHTERLNRCGTPGYIAPEVLNFCEYSEKADMFGVGCILYYLISGQHLFAGQ